MPIRRSPNGVVHPHPQTDRDPPERVIGINWNDCSRSIGTADRDGPVRAGVQASRPNPVEPYPEQPVCAEQPKPTFVLTP